MKLTNKLEVPLPIVRAVQAQLENHKVGGNALTSVTTLNKSPLEVYLKNKYEEELVEDVADSLWRLDGSIAHQLFEMGARSREDEGTFIYESNIVAPILKNGELVGSLSGIVDLFLRSDRTLDDYKKTSVFTIKKKLDGPLPQDDDWLFQTNAYRLLIKKKFGIDVEKIRVWAWMRDWGPRYKDVSPYPIIGITIPIIDNFEDIVADRLIEFIKVVSGDKVPPVCSQRYIYFGDVKKISEGCEYKPGPRCIGKENGYCGVAKFCPYLKEYADNKK